MAKRPVEGEITGYSAAEEQSWNLLAGRYEWWLTYGLSYLRAANYVYERDALNKAWVLLLAHALELVIKSAGLKNGKSVASVIKAGHLVVSQIPRVFRSGIDIEQFTGIKFTKKEQDVMIVALSGVFDEKYPVGKNCQTTARNRHPYAVGEVLDVITKIAVHMGIPQNLVDEINSPPYVPPTEWIKEELPNGRWADFKKAKLIRSSS